MNNFNKNKRKFPGPAGLFPDDFDEADDSIDVTVIPQTQNNFDGNSPAWMQMVCELDDRRLLDSFNIGWIKNKADEGYLFGKKVPFLAAIVSKVSCYFNNYSVSLLDATGEMTAYLTTDVYETYKEELIVGSVAVFVQFSVLTMPNSRNHYPTITGSNLLTIYTPPNKSLSQPTDEVKITKVREAIAKGDAYLSRGDLKRNGFSRRTNPFDPDADLSVLEFDFLGTTQVDGPKNNFSAIGSSKSCDTSGAQDLSQILEETLEGLDDESFFSDW